MACKACKFDHPAMQDCKVAARIRAANERVESVKYIEKKRNTVTKSGNSVTVKAKRSVTKPVTVTKSNDSVTTIPTNRVTVTTIPAPSVTEHPNVYPAPVDLGWDKLERYCLKSPKTAAERMREMRARK